MEPPAGSAPAVVVKKADDDEKPPPRDIKPIKPLNRVPRMFPFPLSFACFSPCCLRVRCLCECYSQSVALSFLRALQNACRKQKMRCEGAENPPCKRCRNTGLECLFEKPSREASLTGEAGLE